MVAWLYIAGDWQNAFQWIGQCELGGAFSICLVRYCSQSLPDLPVLSLEWTQDSSSAPALAPWKRRGRPSLAFGPSSELLCGIVGIFMPLSEALPT